MTVSMYNRQSALALDAQQQQGGDRSKKVAVKRVAAKKAAPAKKVAGGRYVGAYLYCDIHDLSYPRGKSCPDCT
ncbi:hypothetical protein B2G74_27410 [Burkholderia sp. A27]|nr:hypothetical protein B2G74_27410 [Burkholderia sp. A27]